MKQEGALHGGTTPDASPHRCPAYPAYGADEAQCSLIVCNVDKNVAICCAIDCNANTRRCFECIAEGKRGDDARMPIPGKMGVCETHRQAMLARAAAPRPTWRPTGSSPPRVDLPRAPLPSAPKPESPPAPATRRDVSRAARAALAVDLKAMATQPAAKRVDGKSDFPWAREPLPNEPEDWTAIADAFVLAQGRPLTVASWREVSRVVIAMYEAGHSRQASGERFGYQNRSAESWATNHAKLGVLTSEMWEILISTQSSTTFDLLFGLASMLAHNPKEERLEILQKFVSSRHKTAS